MQRIAIAGTSIQATDVAGLESFVRPLPGAEGAFLRGLADAVGASELVFLATCNRIEVIFAREEGDPPDAADLQRLAAVLQRVPAEPGRAPPALRLRTGAEAARHLFRVASSLDSLVLGEDQILAQVREAYGRAADIGLVGPLLGPLFHHALAVGKQARSETGLARHPVSVVTLAVQHLCRRPDAASMVIAVLGAGEMARLLVRALAAAGLPPALIVNRSAARAAELAADCGARAIDLHEFAGGGHAVDVLVSATSAPDWVLAAPRLLALGAATPSGLPLLAIDLAVPRDLQPTDDPRVELVDLDALRAAADRNRALRAEAAALAERLVERKLQTWLRRAAEQGAGEEVAELQAAAEELLARELTGLLGGRLAHLPEADRRAVERWARTTFGRVLHLPVAALKRLAAGRGPDGPGDAA